MASSAITNDSERKFTQDGSKKEHSINQANTLSTTFVKKSPRKPPSLFHLLPLEIRLQIYRHVIHSWIYGSTIHIFDTSSVHNRTPSHCRITYASCLRELSDPYEVGVRDSHGSEWPRGHVCCAMYARREPPRWDLPGAPGRERPGWPLPKQQILEDWRWNQRRQEGGREGRETFLALPLTCRQIYEESISLLYTEFHFDLFSLPIAHRFLTQTPPQHLSKIKSLSLGWSVNYMHARRDEWLACLERELQTVSSIICKMSSLQNLRVSIYQVPNRAYRLEADVCRALRNINLPNGTFVVSLPSDQGRRRGEEISHAAEKDVYKFRIERREVEDLELDENRVMPTPFRGPSPRRRKRTLRKLVGNCCLPCVIVLYVGEMVFEDLGKRLGKRLQKAKIGIFRRIRVLVLNGAEEQEGSTV